MPPVGKDDRGNITDLSLMAPALVGAKLKEAVQRFHERQLAVQLGLQEQRACLDVAATCLRTKKFSGREKYFIAALVTDGLFTHDKAVERGHVSTGKCPLCGEPDSIHHRLWRCLKCASERKCVAPMWAIREARDSPASLLWNMGHNQALW